MKNTFQRVEAMHKWSAWLREAQQTRPAHESREAHAERIAGLLREAHDDVFSGIVRVVEREVHTLDVGGSTPPPATN